MAIDFAYDHTSNLALIKLTGPFDLDEWLRSAEAGRFHPAAFEIVDLRRCRLDALSSMDLFRFTRYLQVARKVGRLIPGKTAILARAEGRLIYTPVNRLFHSFAIFVQENKLPRDFNLFTSVKEALGWLGVPELPRQLSCALRMEAADHHAGKTRRT